MRITIFNGSPRARRGNTHVMVSEFAAGAEASGADVELVFLADHEIKPCAGCYACWFRTPGRCILDDDMNALLDQFVTSDLVVFATPVYVDNVTGLMKTFIDRLIAFGDPHMEKDPLGECRHTQRHAQPSMMLAISNCGFPEQSHFQVLRVLFKRMARNLHCDLVGEIYRSAGGLLTIDQPELKPFVDHYKQLLRRAGNEIVEHRRLSERTKEELEKPLIPTPDFVDEFIRIANQRVGALIPPVDPTED